MSEFFDVRLTVRLRSLEMEKLQDIAEYDDNYQDVSHVARAAIIKFIRGYRK